MQIVGRICRRVLREHGEAIEPSNGGDHAGNRPRREAFVQQFRGPALEVVPLQLCEGLAEARSECAETPQVATVALERVMRQSPLDSQMIEVRVHEVMGG